MAKPGWSRQISLARRMLTRLVKTRDAPSNQELALLVEQEFRIVRAGEKASKYIVRAYKELREAGYKCPRRPRKKRIVIGQVDVSSDAFLTTYAWRTLRHKAITKYGRKCMCCGSTRNPNVDHIKSRRHYPELALEFDNLQVLCEPCNRRKGNWNETDWRPKPVLELT